MLKLVNVVAPLLVVCLLSSGCSVLMIASRDSYRGDLNVIQPGVQRSAVIAEIGQPDSISTFENGGYDDRYTLDPDAHRGVTKFFTGLFYLGADIVTLFLAELIFTPTEIAFKDKLRVYHLTYGSDGVLNSMEKIKP
jgi:hypothetical protein